MQDFDQYVANGVALDGGGQQVFFIHLHFELVIGDRSGFGLQFHEVALSLVGDPFGVILDVIIKAQDVGLVKYSSQHRLQAGDPQRLAHIGNLKPTYCLPGAGWPGLIRWPGRERGPP